MFSHTVTVDQARAPNRRILGLSGKCRSDRVAAEYAAPDTNKVTLYTWVDAYDSSVYTLTLLEHHFSACCFRMSTLNSATFDVSFTHVHISTW